MGHPVLRPVPFAKKKYLSGFRGCGKSLVGQESMPQGLKAHDGYIAFGPGINPRPTLKTEFFRSL
jgi:hypothetical protein